MVESGAGKSLLGKAILGILPSTSQVRNGTIHFGDTELIGIDIEQRRKHICRQISMIPLDPMTFLNPVRRIGKQISEVLQLQMGMDRRSAKHRVLELLDEVQIRNPIRVVNQYPFELSGGMRQRVLIAIAFSCNPKLIVADEPTTALDVTVQRQILRLIKRLQKESHTALLFITHDLGVVAKICHFVSVIHKGQLVEQQPVAKLLHNPMHAFTKKIACNH